MSLGVKYEIARVESPKNQNGTKDTNCENGCNTSRAIQPFVSSQFSTSWDADSLQDDGNKAKPAFGHTAVNQKELLA